MHWTSEVSVLLPPAFSTLFVFYYFIFFRCLNAVGREYTLKLFNVTEY